MYRLRLLIIAIIAWWAVVLNLERPDSILNLGQLKLQPFVYVMVVVIISIMFMVPRLSTLHFAREVTVVLVTYLVLSLIFATSSISELIGDYATFFEIVLLVGTLWSARRVSDSITNFEDTIDEAVLGSANLGFQTFVQEKNTMAGTIHKPEKLSLKTFTYNEQVINEELRRARRYNRRVALFYIRIQNLTVLNGGILGRWNRKMVFQSRYLRVYIIQLLFDFLLKESDIIMWYGRDLVICSPELDQTTAEEFAGKLKQAFEVLMVTSPTVGTAVFPDDALLGSKLLEVASQEASQTQEKSSGPVYVGFWDRSKVR